MVAAASLSGSEIVIDRVGPNPSRTGIIDILRRMGAKVSIEGKDQVRANRSGRLQFGTAAWRSRRSRRGRPGVIDELPVLGALATHGGELHVTGAGELRGKESDRISALPMASGAWVATSRSFPMAFTSPGASA